ncbi:hypothetical protein BGW38_010082, partial [Lunasporangiospora selenospora]
SFSDALRAGLSEDQRKVIASLKPPPRPFQSRRPHVPATTPTSRVYFGGIDSCRLTLLKEKFRALRIRTSAIHNFAFVGRSILELLVENSYVPTLISTLSAFSFRHLPNYDPSVPGDATASPEIRERVKKAYSDRLTKTAGSTTRPVVRAAFLQLLRDASAVIPENLPDKTVAAPLPTTDRVTMDCEMEVEPGTPVETSDADQVAEDSGNVDDEL